MAFKDWYAENRGTLNAARRRRYKKDAGYRKRQLENTRRWRRDRAKTLKTLPPVPKTSFTIGDVASEIGCEQKTIRTLEKVGLLPAISDGVHHRRFTRRQIALVKAIVEFRKNTHYKDSKYKPGLEKLKKKTVTNWGH